MENDSPATHVDYPLDGQTVFATLRDLFAELYPEEKDARVVVADAGLNAHRVAFDARSQTNWHNILTEAIKANRLDPLLNVILVDYKDNTSLQAAYERYRHFIKQGKPIELPEQLFLDNSAPAPGESPYKGLHFFDVRDSSLFYGREQLTAKLVASLHQQRFLAVVGASGSGKSSLVRAGLVPALMQGEPLSHGIRPPEGSAHWPVHIITPTSHPLKSLAASLTRDSESVTATTTLIDDLVRDHRSLDLHISKMLRQHASPQLSASDRLLLVIDQFEELFTLCRAKSEQQAFIDNLLTAVESGEQSTIVITLRADFYAQCAAFDNLRAALANYQEFIGPMNSEELRRAIEEPARRGKWELEPGLVALMLQDVDKEPGALPLLSHALLETWKRRRGRTLTLAGYTASGRVQGAIAQTANAVLGEQLKTLEQQSIVRNIFLRLTELGESTQDTRHRVALSELLPESEKKPVVENVLKTLADARLITIFEAEAEIAHEALIREWPILREWLQDDRDGLRIHHHLTEAAQGWKKLNYDSGALYGGVRLTVAQQWVQQYADRLNSLEHQFLVASIDKEKEREADRQRAIEHTQKIAKYETERARFLTWVVRGLSILLIPSLLYFAGWGFKTWILRTSPWQLVSNFPVDRVSAITFAPANDQDSSPIYCVSTLDVGVGCSPDGITWNVYQQGLAMGVPASGGIDRFAGSVRAVSTMAIDAMRSRTLYAFVYDGYLYKSINGGITWQQSGAKLPGKNYRITKMKAHNGQLFAIAATPSNSTDSVLFTRDNISLTWQLESKVGRAYGLHLSSDGKVIYVATETGLYSSPTELSHNLQKVSETQSIRLIGGVPKEDHLYLATFNEKLNTQDLWRWNSLTKEAQHICSVSGEPRSLTVDPNQPERVYILLTNGKILEIHEDGSMQSLRGLPWWLLIGPGMDLAAVPRGDKHETWLLVGHTIGLLEYKP